MILKRIKKGNISLEQFIDRIEKEVAVFDETYYQPKQTGVINLFVRNDVKALLHHRMTYLQDNLGNLQDSKKAKELISKLREMGQIMGFDKRGFAEQENSNEWGLDLSKQLPTKNGTPFFAWEPMPALFSDILFRKEIEEARWMERKIGPINDSRRNVAYRKEGITIYTKLPDPMQNHGLSFERYVRNGADTRLSFDFGFNPRDEFGYSNNISFNTKEGKLVAVIDYFMNKIDIRTALDKIKSESGVSPQHIKFYLENSNLTNSHREQIADVIDALSSYPKRDVCELFDAQRSKEPLSSRVKRPFLGDERKVEVPRDESYIDLAQLRPHFSYVTVNQMSTEELRNTGLPDKNLSSISLSFKSKSGKGYNLTYQLDNPKKPCLFLGSERHKDTSDLSKVENILKQYMNLGYDGDICDRTDDICKTYKLSRKPTQQTVADAVDSIFTPNFADVKVDDASFNNVYKCAVELSPLAKDKIKTYAVVLIK